MCRILSKEELLLNQGEASKRRLVLVNFVCQTQSQILAKNLANWSPNQEVEDDRSNPVKGAVKEA